MKLIDGERVVREMSNRPNRLYNRAEGVIGEVRDVIREMNAKIKTQAEELRRKDEYIKQLKYERDIRIDPFVTGITTTYGEPKEFVEVVRCKDCKHFVDEGMYCAHDICVMFDHFYCCYGERREE